MNLFCYLSKCVAEWCLETLEEFHGTLFVFWGGLGFVFLCFSSCIYFLLSEHVRNGKIAQFFYDISVISLYFWYKYDLKSNGYAVAFLLLSSVYLPFLFIFSFPKVITFLCCKISLSEPNSYIASEYILIFFFIKIWVVFQTSSWT